MTKSRQHESKPRPSLPSAKEPSTAPGPPATEQCDRTHGIIVVRVQDFTQLFNSLDPSPFLERDLDDDLVDYITSWAREIPSDRPLRLEVQLRQSPKRTGDEGVLRTAIHNHFANSAQLKRIEFRQLMKRGRQSLYIGLAVLATAMVASELVVLAGERPMLNFMRESLIIGGWVAMWRPLELLLYDWWPVRAERQLHERLRDATVVVRAAPAAPPADAPTVQPG